jgi:hypothetical protein
MFVPHLAFPAFFMSSGAPVDVKVFARFSFNKLSSLGLCAFSSNAMNTSVLLLLFKKKSNQFSFLHKSNNFELFFSWTKSNTEGSIME